MVGEVGTTLAIFVFLCIGVAVTWRAGARRMGLWLLVFLVTFLSFQLASRALVLEEMTTVTRALRLITAGLLALILGVVTRAIFGRFGPLSSRGE